MSDTVSKFNATVVDLVNDLARALPSCSELSIVSSLASGMYQLDPGNKTVLDAFSRVVSNHTSVIDNRDEGTALSVLTCLLPSQYAHTVKSIWTTLTDADKNIVWQYMVVLKQQADVANGVVTTVDKSAHLLDNSGIFKIYNNVWKEFIQLLRKYDKVNTAVWETATKTVDSLCKTDPSSLFYQVKMSLSPILQHALTTAQMLELISPKSPAVITDDIKHDLCFVGDSVLPFSKETTYALMLGVVQDNKDHEELLVYWYYTKSLTSILAQCPPEVFQMLCKMADNLANLVPQPT